MEVIIMEDKYLSRKKQTQIVKEAIKNFGKNVGQHHLKCYFLNDGKMHKIK